MRAYRLALFACLVTLSQAVRLGGAEQKKAGLDKLEAMTLATMLDKSYGEVKSSYYDPGFHGVDWDARYRQFAAQIQNAPDMEQGFAMIESFLAGLNDSHTSFIPPARATNFDLGFRLGMVGNDCFVLRVRPGTDGAAKLQAGDKVTRLDGFAVNRGDLPDLEYYLGVLAPRTSNQLEVITSSGERKSVTVITTVSPNRHLVNTMDQLVHLRKQMLDDRSHARAVERGDVLIWRIPRFDLDLQDVSDAIGKARQHETMILDLRGNPGGTLESLQLVLGNLFDRDVKIGVRIGRHERKPIVARHDWHPFMGRLIVLVDSESASDTELLARVVQLEHRGTVIGDRTAGMAMEAKIYPEALGYGQLYTFAVEVTDADLIMSDGKSLEKTGVMPDEILLPSTADLAAGRDPVLARAASEAGLSLDAAEAGKTFPFEWAPL
ncbi:MAG: S41 family peptidase [Terracidiphilus sp.]|jgi:C-terminal processing protease CtpA/Prc